MQKLMGVAGLVLMVLASASPSIAADDKPVDGKNARPEALSRLMDCRAIADGVARLACYDTQIIAFERAEQTRDVVVVDRAQIRKARRSLFGLDIPDFSLFGGSGDKGKAEEEGTTRIEATIANARQGPDGKWILVLENGARWLQIDTRDIPHSPRPGMPIVIRRAAMGSFLANIDKQIAVRVRRAN